MLSINNLQLGKWDTCPKTFDLTLDNVENPVNTS
jgi:hypothetical protein